MPNSISSSFKRKDITQNDFVVVTLVIHDKSDKIEESGERNLGLKSGFHYVRVNLKP